VEAQIKLLQQFQL